MSKPKKTRNKKYSGPKVLQQPTSFKDFEECIRWIKKSVYLIARGRKVVINGKENINWVTLGTGFIAAPKKFITAAHVINDPSSKEEMAQHKTGDNYYLIKHDDEDNWHYRYWEPKMDEGIFLYPDIDLAIINLEDAFYKDGEQTFVDQNTYIRVDQNFNNIGSEVGVLGYPVCNLTFDNGDIMQPKRGDILLRCDKGVVNCRYKTSEKNHLYEFTLSFNRGNSGGPIFDVKTGRLLSIVHGYKVIPIDIKYSIGFATPSFLEVFKEHNII